MPPLDVSAQPDAPADWDDFAREAGSFYHRAAWVGGLGACFDFSVHFITARDGGALVGALPVAQVPALLGPARLVSLPFSYAAGPVSRSPEITRALYAATTALASERKLRRVEIKRLEDESEPPPPFVRTRHYATYRVPTIGGERALWSRLNAGSTQRSIRKGEKSGVIVSRGESVAEWTAMAELEEATAHGHGVPAPPRRFFLELCRSLQDASLADLYLARVPTGETVAGIVLWKGTREWIYAFGASRDEWLGVRPNHVLIWRAMRDAAVAGVTFDLGRAAPEQRGLVEFKTRWGGVPTPLAYDYWPSAAGLNVAPRDTGALAVAARVWTKLPRGIARRGAALYRYLG